MTRLAYILAASHSGSTLLSMLLGSHPLITAIGEMKFLPRAMGDVNRYRCSCGKLIRQCEFWQKLQEGMARRGFDFDLASARMDYSMVESRYARCLLAPMLRGDQLEYIRDIMLRLSPTWQKYLREVQKRNAAVASAVLELTGARIVVDSSKAGLRLKYLRQNPELDVRVIRLVRDGRAVALTYMDTEAFADATDMSLRRGGMKSRPAYERLSMHQAAYEWCRRIEEGEHVLARLDRSRWIQVHYEELCTDTDATLSRIFTFLGLDPDRPIKDFRCAENHVVGNGMRLDSTSEVRLDERWRQVLTAEQLATFDKVAGAMNRKYGYV